MELQNNEREINPVSTWVDGEIRSLNVFRLDNFSNYRFLGDGGTVHWVLSERIAVEDLDSQDFPIACGDVVLPADLIGSWGQDDQPIFDYVMAAINVVSLS